MGNYVSRQPSNPTGKLVFSDGLVREFDRPVAVAELMLEYPQQFVVDCELIVAGKRPAPLPADKELELQKVYFMLPMKRGRSALTVDEVCRILTTVTSVMKSGSTSSSTVLPLFAGICMAGPGKGEVASFPKWSEDKKGELPEFQLENDDERSEYFSRQFSGKGWKPGLDTIEETRARKKVAHWLF